MSYINVQIHLEVVHIKTIKMCFKITETNWPQKEGTCGHE